MTSDDKTENLPVAEYVGCTDLQVQKISYKWTINNFSFSHSYLTSPEFTTGAYESLKWSIILKEGSDYTDYISLYLRFNADKCQQNYVRAKYKLSMLNNQERTIHNMEVKNAQMFISNEFRGFDCFYKRSSLTDYITDDILKIFCEIEVLVNTNEISVSSNVMEFEEPECKLSKNLEGLFHNDKFKDVILVVDGHEIPAHKAILASRSDVFADMFRHEMKGKQLNCITITDIKYEVLKEMLRFMYTGKVSNLNQMADDLLFAAEKYALEELKIMCEKELCQRLSFTTAAETLILAYLHNANTLKAKTVQFINTYATEVKKTMAWKNISITHYDFIAMEFPQFATNSIKKLSKIDQIEK